MLIDYKNKIKRYLFKKYYNIHKITTHYFIIDKVNVNGVVVDIGTGDYPDFSLSVINHYQCICFGFDPTKKHKDILRDIERQSAGKFKYFPVAVAHKKNNIVFYESLQNVSGSFWSDHINIKKDKTRRYKVDIITFEEMFHLIGDVEYIDIVKMDIEGGEYDIIQNLKRVTADRIGQFIIEFHHHCIDQFTKDDTLRCVNRLKSYNFKEYTEDEINYLFFKP